jgi:hypothetical protein
VLVTGTAGALIIPFCTLQRNKCAQDPDFGVPS